MRKKIRDWIKSYVVGLPFVVIFSVVCYFVTPVTPFLISLLFYFMFVFVAYNFSYAIVLFEYLYYGEFEEAEK